MSENTIALIGNPNVGKTVIFNCLTGSKAHVANWPGVTVEKKTGKMENFLITDLPGVYSLTPTAIDYLIARNYIIEEKPKLVVDIIDATNLERNLYLGLLLKEMGIPIIFVLNMMDSVKEKGIEINLDVLSSMLNAPIIKTAAIKEEGISELKKKIKDFLKKKSIEHENLKYSVEIENKIKKVLEILKNNEFKNPKDYPHYLRWLSIKLLENDQEINKKLKISERGKNVVNSIEHLTDPIEIASARYSLISEICQKCYKKEKQALDRSEFLDQFFLDKKIGIPIFLIIMWGVFELTFKVGTPFLEIIEALFGFIGESIIEKMGETFWASFLSDGLINGFGSIIVFLPNIMLMFLALSFLEDSGYLSRAAFLMDRIMYKVGLHGRSFVSMLLGFGCNVPAIMSTRAIESEEDRIVTIMANQNISCGARLPVYILIGGAIWGSSAGNIIFSLYIMGIFMAVLVALAFRKILNKGEKSPFILELGDFRQPTLKYTTIHMWERSREFIKKAGTIIFLAVIVMWFLQIMPLNQTGPKESWLYKIGEIFQPIFSPLNFGVIAVVGLIFGFLAKEVIIAAYGLMMGVDEESEQLGELIANDLGNSPVIAYSYLTFVLLYTPCVAVIGAIKRETGSWKWAAVSVIYGLILAYAMALLVQVIGGVF